MRRPPHHTDAASGGETRAATNEGEPAAVVDSIAALVAAMEALRVRLGINKAELARRTGTRPEVMRRLFTADAPNPTLATVLTVLRVLGHSLALVPADRAAGAKSKRKGK